MFILFYICINLWFCIECLTVTMPVDIPLVIFYLYIVIDLSSVLFHGLYGRVLHVNSSSCQNLVHVYCYCIHLSSVLFNDPYGWVLHVTNVLFLRISLLVLDLTER